MPMDAGQPGGLVGRRGTPARLRTGRHGTDRLTDIDRAPFTGKYAARSSGKSSV